MLTTLRYTLFLFLIAAITVSYAQVPVVSYSSPQTYFEGMAITPLVPTSSGVAAPGTGTGITTLGTGFNNITGVAIDKSGNVYVVANGTNDVWKIPAGGGTQTEFATGFNQPTGVAVDAAGNVYVVDNINNALKEIPAGSSSVVTLVTGFNSPYGVAVDASGNLYIGDSDNNEVEKIPAGTTNKVVIASGLDHPTGVAVDAAGNVYVADRGSNTIKEIPVNGGSVIVLSSGEGNPNGVAVDSFGNVYFADTDNASIMEIPVGGGSLINIGSGFITPTAVAINGSNIVFVGDNGNTAVKEIAPAGGYFIAPALPAGLSMDNATGIISGTPTVVSPATNYIVTAYNSTGGTSAVVNITVTNALLSNIALNPVSPLTTVTGPGFANYTAAVANSVTSTALVPTARIAGTTITVNGVSVASGASSASIPLSVGANPITIIATASGGATSQTYIVTVGRGASVATLSHISISSGTLTPVTGTPNYTVSVANGITSVTVTPTTTDPNATIKVNGTAVTSGTASAAIPLSLGSNTINIVVTAQNGVSTQPYVITVTRAKSNNIQLSHLSISPGTLSPVSGTPNYTANVTNATTSVTVIATTTDPNATVTVNGAPVVSGTASAPIALAEGVATTINTVVTAQDGTTMQTYVITVTRAPSTNAGLANLVISSGTLTPAFATGTTSYAATVTNATASITLTPSIVDPNATIKINGVVVTPGTTSAPINLVAGAVNTITTVVTAQNNSTTQTYTVAVTRQKSSNAALSNLVLSSGALTPVFATGTISYTASVSSATTSVTLTPTASDANATIKVNGAVVASGTASASLPLNTGTNSIIVAVTAQDGVTTETYIVTVGRGASVATLSHISISSGTLTPVTGTPNYTVNVANGIASVTVTLTTTDPNATIKVNGTAVTSGTASAAIPLSFGSNTINIVVTAQNGITTQPYVITVTRPKSSNALLSHISISAGTLAPVSGSPNYTASVSNATSSVTVTATTADANATVTVNGATVTSGTPSGAIALNVGTNTISIVVTAQDGVTTQPYLITVTRAKSSNALLSNLAISSGTLTPISGSPNFTASVTNATTSVKITPTTADPNATLTVNGTTLASGTASAAIPLVVGNNTITIVVTAQDGVTTQSYIITVTRPSNIASLSHISISSGTLTPVTGTPNYTVSVANTVTSVTVTPTTTDPNATVKINGAAVISGKASAAIPLSVGSNTINIVVTAQDGVTTQPYVITVTRAKSTNALLSSLHISSGTLTPVSGSPNYTVSVANAITSVTITPTTADPNATVKVNGTAVTSGTVSAAIPLSVGSNTINIVVTAQDGVTTQSYVITVTRATGPLMSLYQPVSVVPQTQTIGIENDGVLVHQGVSPNGDGINDVLTIDGIIQYPDNQLTIIDRNGSLIFQAKGYNNISKAFDGHSGINGKLLQPGTYFYALDYNVNGESKHKTGFILLKY